MPVLCLTNPVLTWPFLQKAIKTLVVICPVSRATKSSLFSNQWLIHRVSGIYIMLPWPESLASFLVCHNSRGEKNWWLHETIHCRSRRKKIGLVYVSDVSLFSLDTSFSLFSSFTFLKNMSSALTIPTPGPSSPSSSPQQSSSSACNNSNYFLDPLTLKTGSSSYRQNRKYRHPDRHRDCFQILQTIIQENERREREEYEEMVRDIPEIVISRRLSNLPGILVKSPAPRSSQHSVRFAADPPKVFRSSISLSSDASH